MFNAKQGTITAIIPLLLFAMSGSIAREVIYHTLDPPYNPSYIGRTPSPNDPNNYFFLRSDQPQDSYGYNINIEYSPIMRDQYFYRDYGDWVSGDYEDWNTGW